MRCRARRTAAAERVAPLQGRGRHDSRAASRETASPLRRRTNVEEGRAACGPWVRESLLCAWGHREPDQVSCSTGCRSTAPAGVAGAAAMTSFRPAPVPSGTRRPGRRYVLESQTASAVRRQALAGDRVPHSGAACGCATASAEAGRPRRPLRPSMSSCTRCRRRHWPIRSSTRGAASHSGARSSSTTPDSESLDEVVHHVISCLDHRDVHRPTGRNSSAARSNVATTGLPTSSGNRTRCGIVGFVTQGPPLCEKRLSPTVF